MTTQSAFTVSRWVTRRLIPCLLLVLAGATIAGFFRAYLLFIPGIMGMIAGGVLGWATGRIGRGDPETVWSFGHRAALAVGAGVLYAIASAAVISVLHVGAMGLPLDWLGDVVAGHEGELFAGTSTNSFQSVEGALSGAWWMIFVFIDGLLFSFLFLVTTAVGWKPDDDPDLQDETAHELPPPLTPTTIGAPLSLVSFGVCAILSMGVIGLLATWPYLAAPPDTGISESQLISELQGEWVFGEEAAFLGRTVDERSFTLSRGLGTELAGFSKISASFMLSMEMRRDGVFEGRLNMGARGLLSLRMRPSEDRNEIAFSVDWHSAAGRTEKSLTARRIDAEPLSNAESR